MALGFRKDTRELVAKAFEDVKIPDKYLDGFINQVARIFDNSNVVFERDIFPMWSRTVYDKNPLHQDEKYARAVRGMNFTTTPVFGTLIAGNGESLINKITDELNFVRSRKILYTGNHVKYNGPLYPGEELIWHPGRVISKKDEDKNLFGFNLILEGKKDNKKVVTNIAKLRFNRNSLEDDEELDKIREGKDPNVVLDHVLNLNHGNLNDKNKMGGMTEYRLASGYNHSKFPLMFPAALVPAGLLKLSYDALGKYEGSYFGMDFEFYARARLGDCRVVIKNATIPKNKRGGYAYDFRAMVLQTDNPILSGKFKCFSSENMIV